MTKRKKELDSEYDGGNEVSSTIPKPAQEPQSGNKEISKPGQKSRKEISPSPTGPATVQKSPGPKKERRKSLMESFESPNFLSNEREMEHTDLQ